MLSFSPRPWRRVVGALFSSFALVAFTAGQSPAWQTAHGDPDNSGFVDVTTAPAKAPLATVPRLGGVAPGTGPVVAPNGTVYIANMRGKLMAFQPDGTRLWTRDIGGQGVLSSPALGMDGSIYVVGTAKVRDHTVSPVITRTVTELYKFNSTGALLWHAPMPKVYGGLSGDAPPNIWRNGGGEAIIVPGIFRQDSAQFEMHLVAFSTDGRILADKLVSNLFGDVTGSGLPVSQWWEYPCYFITLGHGCGSFSAPQGEPVPPAGTLPDNLMNPLPAAAIRTPDFSSTPQIVVADSFHDLVGYSFNGNAFQELYRARDAKRVLLGTPMLLNDGHAMIAVRDKDYKSNVLFAARGLKDILVPTAPSFASPTRLKDGRFAIVHHFGGVSILRGGLVDATAPLPGQSVASAAASRNHLFVSTVLGLHTLDPASLTEVANFEWARGGVNMPVIGPQGHVYAIADDTLFIFGPPLNVTANNTTTTGGSPATNGNGGPVLGGGIFQDSGFPVLTSGQSQSFQPPLTAGSNRLFACEKLDSGDCGKSTNKKVALAFCQQKGFAGAGKFDTDVRKVKAETLGGQFCSKKKCEVFDEIVCTK
ncbi:MAG: hypothetical protein R3D05_04800 [Dongiaceae bacterium]